MTGRLHRVGAATRRLGGLLVVLCLQLGLPAACAAFETRQEGAYERGLIWRVDGAGEMPSYVFGTLHAADARLRDLPPAVRTAFDAAGIAAFELDDSRLDQAELMEAILLPPGRRLEDILGPTLFQRAAAIVAPPGIFAEGLQNLKPWALITVLTTVPRETLQPSVDGQRLDSWLQAEARRRGKTVYGLETAAEQIAVFEEMTEADQIAMVADLVNHHHETQARLGRELDAYLAGDDTALMAEQYNGSRSTDETVAIRFFQRAIVSRNHVMVERMLPLLARDATFVAVGASHLLGEQGILRLLELRGFTVTRLE